VRPPTLYKYAINLYHRWRLMSVYFNSLTASEWDKTES
jgi:hypothetical protein